MQIQRVIGEEDVERFRRELAAEGGEAEEAGEEGEEGDATAAARAGDAGGLGDDDDDNDGDGFFGTDDVGEQEYVELSSADIFNRPGRDLQVHTSVNANSPRTVHPSDRVINWPGGANLNCIACRTFRRSVHWR